MSSLPVVRRARHLAGRLPPRATPDPTTSPPRCGATTRATWSAGWTRPARWSCDELPARLDGPISLALPAPGDPVGLGGPPELNLAALDAGQAVVVGDVGLVPVEDARTIVWCAQPAERVPWVDERETAIELRTALTEVTMRLVDLDVASWQPEIPDLLMNLRKRPRLPLPPGYDARRVETVERAVLCLDIVELARAGDGGAVSSYEMDQRRAALGDLRPGRPARAGRRLLGPLGLTPRPPVNLVACWTTTASSRAPC